MRTEKEKMLAGEVYDCADNELLTRWHKAKQLQHGKLMTYEFKWNPKRSAKFPKAFSDNYPEATFTVITPDNIEEFLL